MTSTRSKPKRLTPEEIGQMVGLWEVGGVSQRELGEHFGVSLRTVKKKLAEAGAKKGRKQRKR